MLNTKYLLPKILFVTLLACGIVLATSVTFSNPLAADDIRPISRVSVASDGSQAMFGTSEMPEIAVQGRLIAFKSRANNLVENDTNDAYDIFVHDTQSGETTRVSVSSSGEQANERSEYFDISENGRFITFESFADNLVEDDNNSSSDIFLHDRETGETVLISVSSSEEQGNGNSEDPAISADGRFVAFNSFANNLVANDTNAAHDIFVRDTQLGETYRVSVTSQGEQSASSGDSEEADISADGQVVTFVSGANNLVSDDTNGDDDIFVHDRQTGVTSRASVNSEGQQSNEQAGNPAISADGQHVVFESHANDLVENDTNPDVDVFRHNRQTGETILISVSSDGTQANGESSRDAAVSANGQFVVFTSDADNLVEGDSNDERDIFVRDVLTGETIRVSMAWDGAESNYTSDHGAISDNGNFVAFDSRAGNLVMEDDTNNYEDVFVVTLRETEIMTYIPYVTSSP